MMVDDRIAYNNLIELAMLAMVIQLLYPTRNNVFSHHTHLFSSRSILFCMPTIIIRV